MGSPVDPDYCHGALPCLEHDYPLLDEEAAEYQRAADEQEAAELARWEMDRDERAGS